MTRLFKRTATVLMIAIIVFAAWLVWCHPDWIVAGPPKQHNLLAQPAILETPVTSTADDTSKPAAIPTTNKPTEVAPAQIPPQMQISDDKPADFKRSDGFANMCYKMEDGTYTTVIYQGPGGPGMYPYQGAIDPATESPANAADSQAWCAAHDPNTTN